MNIKDFLEGVRRIAASNPTYRTGGDGSDGTCDCIGLIMGAMGGKFDMHSTNWFARYQTFGMDPIHHDTYEPEIGDILYKARNPSNPKYDLHERYVTGRYATGDLLDYYHVGVVTNVAPLEITHCTSTGSVNGIAYDSTAESWTHVGILANVDYDEPAMVEEAATANKVAVVYSENRKPVKLRPIPSTDKPYIAEVPFGAQVEIIEKADGWAKVIWGSKRGYMMTDFLGVIGKVPADEPAKNKVTITLSASAALELQKALSGVL